MQAAGDRAGGARGAAGLIAASLAAIAAGAGLAGPAAAPEREALAATHGDARPAAYRPDALRAATRLARRPRPAGSRAELRAHAFVARGFRRAGLEVDVQRFAVPGRGRSRNVIGRFGTPRRCLRIVVAHTDTAAGAPGANDNASGVATLVALAPRLKRLDPGCDVWLVATGAEERVYTGSPDHLGALALARRVRARRLPLRWALSLDEVGRDRPFWLRSPVSSPRAGVETALLHAGRRAGTAVSWVRDDDTGNSDHREFQLLGLPAAKVGVGTGGEPCRHAPCDVASRLDRESLRQARRLVERALSSS